MSFTRRQLLQSTGAALWAGSGLLPRLAAVSAPPAATAAAAALTVPDGRSLTGHARDGVKVFHLVAEEFDHEFAPGLRARCWGYNGGTPGPVIEAVEGDRVRIYVTNHLPEATTVHWHGLFVPSGMDGVAGISQPAIRPGETYRYEFTLRQHGTFMYHPHADEMTQMALGLVGMVVIHPRVVTRPVERDFALMIHEWRIDPGARRPDPLEMTEFNVLTFNGRCFPGTSALLVRRGERVRLRFGNLSAMEHHPIHLHGFAFRLTATEGGDIPASAQWPETTVLVPVGTTRTVEFVADTLGDWALHCHMTHHAMNQMGHGLPNLIGVDARAVTPRLQAQLPGYMAMGETGFANMAEMGMAVPANSIPMVGAPGPQGYIDMGGMFSVLKVRDELPADGSDPGWYRPPAEEQARVATAEEIRTEIPPTT